LDILRRVYHGIALREGFDSRDVFPELLYITYMGRFPRNASQVSQTLATPMKMRLVATNHPSQTLAVLRQSEAHQR